MASLPKQRINTDVLQEIVPEICLQLPGKAEAVRFHRVRDTRPCRSLLGDHTNIREKLVHHGVQMAQEFHCSQIPRVAVHIRRKPGRLLTIVEIQHRREIVGLDPVRVIGTDPVERVRDEII